jgi:hypothetical protein
MFNKGAWLHVIRGGLEVLHLLITVASPAARTSTNRMKKATRYILVASDFLL